MLGRFTHPELADVLRECPNKLECRLLDPWLPRLDRFERPTAVAMTTTQLSLLFKVLMRGTGRDCTYHGCRSGCVNELIIREKVCSCRWSGGLLERLHWCFAESGFADE
jgi:hypothetical protein